MLTNHCQGMKTLFSVILNKAVSVDQFRRKPHRLMYDSFTIDSIYNDCQCGKLRK